MKDEIGTGIAEESTVSEIAQIIREYDKTEYGKVIAERADYPILYHLAAMRSNVVEWLPIQAEDKVLELGAECGALSAMLLDKCGDLTCLTDTVHQKEVIEQRLSKEASDAAQKKRTVCAGSFRENEKKLESYDWIILTGMLGYACEIMKNPDSRAYTAFLTCLKGHLKTEGTLVLIDSNRLGLKYLAGCQDDHYGDYFSGIQNYAGRDGYRTFTRKEYRKMLEEAGMEEMEWYYPYPDYKFPMEIYSDAFLPKKGELNDNMRNADRDRYVLFQETAAFNTLIGEGLFPEFSNSFLILAGQKKCPGEKIIFSKYSNERSIKLQICTDIVQKENGEKRVRKHALLPEGKENIVRIVKMYRELSEAFRDPKVSFCESVLREGCAESPFLTGTSLQELMETAADGGKEEVLTEYIRTYIAWIREDGGSVKFTMTPEFEEIFGKVDLPETLECAKVSDIDLIFANILIQDGKWQIIDYEWSFDFPIPKNFVIYRSLFFAHHRIRQCKALELGHLYEMAGFTGQEVKAYEQMEKHFQDYISGNVFPLRDMYQRTGTKRITLNEIEQIRGEIELRQLTAGSKGKKGSMIKKIQYHIDRIEYKLGKAICGGWAFAVTKTGEYLPVNIRLENERKEPVDAAFSRNARGDVAQALKLENQKGTDWGFNYTWLTDEEVNYRMIFSVDGYEVVHRVTTEDLDRSFREYRRRYPNAKAGKQRKDDKRTADDWYYLRTEGIRALRAIQKQRFNKKQVPYTVWRTYQVPQEQELLRQKAVKFEKQPLISIIVPAYRTPEKFLREMIESVQAQSYQNWELCIADGSLNDSIKNILEEYAGKDPRVRYKILDGNYGISGNTNAALEFAKGDYIGLLDHDDLLEPDALYENVKRINEEDAKVLYSDEDKVSLDLKEYFDPHFKPDYNRDYMQCCNYICHFFVVERKIVEEAGHFDSSCDGSQDYDFILRCIAKSPKVTHIPKVLYHWRCHPDSTALNPESKLYCYEAGKRALELDLAACGEGKAKVEMGKYYGMYEVYYPLEEKPLVSVITGKRENIEGLLSETDYDRFEVVEYGEQETTAAVNEAVKRAKGAYCIFLPEGIRADRSDWITVMAANAARGKIGIVGPKLLNETGHVVSAGMALGLRATASSLFVGNEKESVGYFSRTIIQQEIGAVAFEGMMVERDAFLALGGFRETFRINEAALELCLKVQKNGQEVLFTPFVSLEITDDRFAPGEVHVTDAAFEKEYGEMIKNDRYYSRNFDKDGADYTLAFE